MSLKDFFISTKDANEEKKAIYLKSENIDS